MGPATLIDNYENGSQLLRKAIAGMSQEQLVARPISGKWSTLEVVCHLADFEIVYADRIKRVISENEPTLFGGDPDLFAARLAYHQRNAEEEVQFTELIRRQVARILRTLKEDDFQRRGIHSEAGPLTLETLLQRVTGHIPHHVRFIEEKRGALGP
jgi:uncharacterized damage-inducible protein DinB